MRPRKRVLLYGADERTLEIVCFALNVGRGGLQAMSAGDECDFVRAFEALQPHAVVFFHRCPVAELCAYVKQVAPETQTLLINRSSAPPSFPVDYVLIMKEIDMAKLRERIQILASRKRGPKKPAQAATPEDEFQAVRA